ncbi:MAG: hypothetical protein N4A68_11785 [Maledivibacter sp.]|jgi:Flp pilus assembly protein TadB|nr:hypothetical protein [Maledivibacter sp.]
MIYVALAVLLAAAIYLFLYTLFLDYNKYLKSSAKTLKGVVNSIKDINRIEKSLEERIFQVENQNKRKARINLITGAKKSLDQRIKESINDIVMNRNHSWGYLIYSISTIGCVMLGYTIGIRLNNIGAAFILATVGTSLPYIYLTYVIEKKKKLMNKDLLMVMGNITSIYMNSNSFVTAVDEVVPTIPKTLYGQFKLFVDEIKYFGEDSFDEAAIRLANSINNYFFYEYIQLAIQAEKGENGLKYTMKSVPVDYQAYLSRNEKFNRKVEKYNIQFLMMLCILPLAIKFLQVVSDDYYNILVNNIIGKVLLFLIIIVYIVASFLFRRYNKEVKLEL